ncbi:toprim domain-containing protein [Nesterenkonia sp. CL21]|uniref:toprim domain-containing protein n=1 Tax=Nesterenkonia sp. CL21 TaxID=3064894 RepID=UPI0028790AAE|nr:toprim domain-containing protein [Nesterenkonia sp. CL21]MDS2171590.1 toprim domain-containing protein [Nesterenkonia sp. CL21]
MISRPLSSEQKSELGSQATAYQAQLQDHGEAMEYLLSRGLTEQTVADARLGYVGDAAPEHQQVQGRISIPYLTTSGVVKLRFRAMPSSGAKAKYMDLGGADVKMYNALALARDQTGSTAYITEGEMDALIAQQLGYTAVGIAGVQGWRDHFGLMLDGFENVVILADNDDKGQGAEFGDMLASKLGNRSVKVVLMPAGHDVNSAYVDGGAESLRDWIQGSF